MQSPPAVHPVVDLTNVVGRAGAAASRKLFNAVRLIVIVVVVMMMSGDRFVDDVRTQSPSSNRFDELENFVLFFGIGLISDPVAAIKKGSKFSFYSEDG